MNKKLQFILAIILTITSLDLLAGCYFTVDTIKIKSCNSANEVCLPGLPLELASNAQILVNNSKYTGLLAGCDIDTIFSYVLNKTTISDIGPYYLNSWKVLNKLTGVETTFSGAFAKKSDLLDSMNKWNPTGLWHFDPNNLEKITGGDKNFSYSSINFDEIVFKNKVINRQIDLHPLSTVIFLPIGLNKIIVNDINCSDTIIVLINCTISDVISRSIVIGQSDTICLDFKQLSGKFVSIENICKNKSGKNIEFSTIKNDSCIVAKALNTNIDTACYVICDQYGFCDTTFFYIKGKSLVGTAFVYDTITKQYQDTLCINTKFLPGKPISISNICKSSGNFSVNYTIDSISNCIYAAGLSNGTDTACIVVCDDKGFCDTTKWVVTTIDTKDINEFYDTIYINQKVDTCLGSKFVQNIVAIKNLCPSNSGNEVDINVTISNNFCQNSGGKGVNLTYLAKGIGQDTACIEIVDQSGKIDTVKVIISVIPIAKTIVKDTIYNGSSKNLVLSIAKLTGNIQSVKNNCTSIGKYVTFSQPTINQFFINAQSKDLGTDTSCWVICDQYNSCDTIIWIVTVTKSTLKKPIAVDDSDTVIIGSSKMILVLNNDNIEGSLKKFALQTITQGGIGPLYGLVMLDTLGNLLYNPTTSDCNKLDFFKYIICNEVGCDTALVTIYLKCKEEIKPFFIYNAFSPNEDDVNDVFKIDGLEQYPNHTLYIFNRWGQELLNTKNYQNDWTGTWNSDILPDGTYFYLFDTGKGEMIKGYIEIRR